MRRIKRRANEVTEEIAAGTRNKNAAEWTKKNATEAQEHCRIRDRRREEELLNVADAGCRSLVH